uniref:Uncharacterized protein n=1 Tax=Salix viminalis TaxID=40686 RepID=A0A6N2L1L8_SALVM
MRGATRGLPRRSPILVLLSPKHFSEFWDEISGGLRRRGRGRLRRGAGGIKSREGHSFEPHSLIAVGLQRLSGIRHGVKREGVKRGGQKRERGLTNEGCNTRTSQEVTHPSTTLAQARLTAEF